MPIPVKAQHERNRHHIGLAANAVGELIQRKQRGQRRIGERFAARHGKHAPLEIVRALHGLACANEALPARVDRRIDRIDCIGAHVHNVFVPKID